MKLEKQEEQMENIYANSKAFIVDVNVLAKKL